MEFHVSRTARDKYVVDDLLFSYQGNVVFANVSASRRMAKQINDIRKQGSEEGTIHGGALFAMGLIDELSHAMVAKYRTHVDPDVMGAALAFFEGVKDRAGVEALLLRFADLFPNVAVYRGKLTAAEWIEGETDGVKHRETAIEEMLLLWLANGNLAYLPFLELFDERELKDKTIYSDVVSQFQSYFATRRPFGSEGTLLDVLKAPMLASPDSLIGQLAYIRERWVEHLGEDLRRVLLATDVLNEEEIALWMQFHPHVGGRGPEGPPGGESVWRSEGFEGDEFVGFGPGGRTRGLGAALEQPSLIEYEAFSQDQDWMPTVVLLAKSTYVWLEQLSQKYGRHIHKLDQIPDEEMELIASRGVNGLWLIGLWERSVASQTIKRLRGQADAVASAYSLRDYRIADDLGGSAAYEVLRNRAAKAGIRLASDMVPNHMGIDSTWVMEHPDWFISRGASPFPSYSFDGPDLSTESRYEIKIEDHYYDETDAAVAFRLRDRATGRTEFLYHGNDGTTFAWNDTAQLDYSKTYVREQVIQTILSVARQFPIIRFDAAMVLAKKHVQRLWFPLPGMGGSIPSRAEDAMSQEEFDWLMPNEFWREVVDRVAVEVPGTLLLAEAFWLLEGYFVRTLGMHRVYNSAFMNMLRDEENAKYRSYLKKTIEFDPDILKRYVNFMSNPDERTAIDQFGAGDKYFGVSTLLATLPGLPMFGHGQIEGFTEKYGMEYKRARFQEYPNEDLLARHQREIAPLLKKRWAFAESNNFVLYDFWNEHGNVDENVFAYSNVSGGERSLVIYNNAYGSTGGTVHVSAVSMDKGSGTLRQRSLHEAMQLPGDDAAIMAYRDTTNRLEYLRRAGELRIDGFTVNLRGYQYVVLQEWRELRVSSEQPWDRMCDALHGAGVYSVDEALSKLRLRPVHDALRQVLNAEVVGDLIAAVKLQPGAPKPKRVLDIRAKKTPPNGTGEVSLQLEKVLARVDTFFERVEDTRGTQSGTRQGEISGRRERLAKRATAMLRLPGLHSASPIWPAAASAILPSGSTGELAVGTWATILAWSLLRELRGAEELTSAGEASIIDSVCIFDELQLRSALAEIFSGVGILGEDAWRAAARVRVLLQYGANPQTTFPGASEAFWNDGDVRYLTGANESDGIAYLNKEAFHELLWWMEIAELMEPEADSERLGEVKRRFATARKAADTAGYRISEYVFAAGALSPMKAGVEEKTVLKEANAKLLKAAAGKTSVAKAKQATPKKQATLAPNVTLADPKKAAVRKQLTSTATPLDAKATKTPEKPEGAALPNTAKPKKNL